MRRTEREITNTKSIKDILRKENTCRLAMNDKEYPYIVALNYGYANNALYIHCAREGKKINLLKRNSKVAFQIESGCEIVKHSKSCQWSTRYQSLVGKGQVEIVDDYEEKIKGLDIIMQHAGKMENEYNSKAVNNVLILKVNIIEISGKQAGDQE